MFNYKEGVTRLAMGKQYQLLFDIFLYKMDIPSVSNESATNTYILIKITKFG